MTSPNEPKYTYGSVATFSATCNSCGHIFGYPLLSDMSYGEFIAKSARGGLYAYVSAFTGEWDEIERILDTISPGRRTVDPRGDRFQWIIGRCLDPLEGQSLSIDSGPICPGCQSRDVKYGNGERLGFLRIPDATWTRFKSLSAVEKYQYIEKLWKESKSL